MKRKNKIILQLQPSAIRFTQDSVAMYFQDKHEVNETCEEIALGKLQVTQLPKIRVKLQNGKYFSVDNRRLYVFRVLEKLDFLATISVTDITTKKKQLKRDITTENNGCHVKIRSRPVEVNGCKNWPKIIIYRHCSCTNAWKGTEIPDWWDSHRKCHRNINGIVPNPCFTIDDVTKVPQNNKIRKFEPQEMSSNRLVLDLEGAINNGFNIDTPNTNLVKSNDYLNPPNSKCDETNTPQVHIQNCSKKFGINEMSSDRLEGEINNGFNRDTSNTNPEKSNDYLNPPKSKCDETNTPQEISNIRLEGAINNGFNRDTPNTNPVKSNDYLNPPKSKCDETNTPQEKSSSHLHEEVNLKSNIDMLNTSRARTKYHLISPKSKCDESYTSQTTKEEDIFTSSTNNASMKKVTETNLSREEPTQETNATTCSPIIVNPNECNMNIDANAPSNSYHNNSTKAETKEFPKNSYKYYIIAVVAAVAIVSLYYYATFELPPSNKPMVPSSNASSLLSKNFSKTRSWLPSWWSGERNPTENATGFSTAVSSSVNRSNEMFKSEKNITQTDRGIMENLTWLTSWWSGERNPTENATDFSTVVSNSVYHLSEMFKSERDITQTVRGTMENLTNLASWWSGGRLPAENATGFSTVVSSSVNRLSEMFKSERNITQFARGMMETLTNLASWWRGGRSLTENATNFFTVVSSLVNRLSEMFKRE